MDNEPNEREKEIANDPKRICLMESATGVRKQIARALANYRAELRPEPTADDRKAAARIIEDINCELVSDKPVVLTEEWIDKIAAALSAARGDAARKAHKAGWESAMYDAHVNYGADDGAPAPELTDANVAAILEGVKA